MLKNNILATRHLSRFATILSRLATFSIIIGIGLLLLPLIQVLIFVFYFMIMIGALIVYGAITLMTCFALLAAEEWRNIGLFILGGFTEMHLTDVLFNIASTFCPYFLIGGFIAMVVSLILFIFSKNDERSKGGILYTAIFLGVAVALVVLILVGIAIMALKGGA